MSTALDFTVDIGSLPTRNQGPLKAKNGMFVNKPQERRFESDKMLAEAPPENLMAQTVPSPRFNDYDSLSETEKQQLDQYLKRLQLNEQMERERDMEKDLRDDRIKDFLQYMYNQQFGERLQASAMSPEMEMIMKAQNNMGGIMSAPLSGVPKLMAKTKFDI